jgi:hypothetical protein
MGIVKTSLPRRGMPRYARHDRMKGQDRVWGFLASLETTEKGCRPEPLFYVTPSPFLSPRAPFFVAPSSLFCRPEPFFMSPRAFFLLPRAKRGVPQRPHVGVPRRFRASGRHGWAVTPSPFFMSPRAFFYVTPSEARGPSAPTCGGGPAR